MTTPRIPMSAVCRWCRNPVPTPIPEDWVCSRNTQGCGPGCGFTCDCDPNDWEYGPHEPTVMGFSITYDTGGHPVFLIVDEDRARAVEWCWDFGRPWQIIHSAVPCSGREQPTGCSHIPGFCFPAEKELSPALADLYRRVERSPLDEDANEQLYAALRLRWRLG